jgi:hypothetical protein
MSGFLEDPVSGFSPGSLGYEKYLVGILGIVMIQDTKRSAESNTKLLSKE